MARLFVPREQPHHSGVEGAFEPNLTLRFPVVPGRVDGLMFRLPADEAARGKGMQVSMLLDASAVKTASVTLTSLQMKAPPVAPPPAAAPAATRAAAAHRHRPVFSALERRGPHGVVHLINSVAQSRRRRRGPGLVEDDGDARRV